MIINRELKHLHVHVMKTGGSSLRTNLTRHKWNKKSDRLKGLSAHSTLKTIENNPYLLDELGDFHKTIMIRNPWEHAVSAYHYVLDVKVFYSSNYFAHKNFKKNAKQFDITNLDFSFERFVKNGYKGFAQSNFTYESNELKFDEWFDYRDYNKMIRYFSDKYNINLVNDIRQKYYKNLQYIIDMDINKPYQEFYNDNSYEIVKNISKNEIKRFNYKF